jgi:MFS family permease
MSINTSYSKNFWLMCLAIFVFTLSFNLLMPEFNTIMEQLGGRDFKGLSIILFTLSAGLSRPSAGKLADKIGRKKVMLIGVMISIIVSLGYSFANTLSFFLFLRLMHGFCQGFFPTAATALMIDILPEHKRGQGMAAFGTAISLGIGIGQGFSSQLILYSNISFLFYLSTLLAIISGLLVYYIRETLEEIIPFNKKDLLLKKGEYFEKSVAPAAIVMFLSAFCSGLVFVITPDFSEFLGIKDKGWFFMVYVSSTIVVRLLSGGMSDRIGRKQTILFAMILCLTSMIMLAFCHSYVMYNISALVFGFATGIASPAIFAWTADLSNPSRRGIGSGTMFIALEFGIMSGSVSTIFTYNNTIESLRTVFLVGSVSASFACLYLMKQIKTEKMFQEF